MNANKIRLVLALLGLPGVGRRTARGILDRLTIQPGSPEELRMALAETIQAGLRLPESTFAHVERAWRNAGEIIDRSARLGIKIIESSSWQFPSLVADLADPPLLLHMLGDAGCLRGELICALVGTRLPSGFGRKWAREAGEILAREGAIVVSGLALGCDTAGHEGCLEAGGKTVAVLGHGLDIVYPLQNKNLARRILDSGGALVSEYPIGSPPARWRFVERDRLQAGLSYGLILVEADISDGSMHAVSHCLAMGRPLSCLRPPEETREAWRIEGNRALIDAGKAVPLAGESDLADLVLRLKSQS